MKKLIFCCLVVLMGACKDKNKEVDPENNYAAGFVGTYGTPTVNEAVYTEHSWEVARVDNNRLKIAYAKNFSVDIPGQQLTGWQKFELQNVTVISADKFKINEIVDAEQNNGVTLKQTVEGEGTKVTNGNGVQQINIEIKITATATGVTTTEYLEFKKK
jgi:hypothetical protein